LGPAAQAVNVPLRELRKTIRVLRIMSILTRIESGRVGSKAAGFESLAGEVETMATGIDGKAGAILEAADGMRKLARQAQAAAAVLERREQADLLQMTTESAQGIQALQAEQEHLAAASRDAHARWERVLAGINDVLMSLQSHDATRQRLEHVQAALVELADGLAAQKQVPSAAATSAMVELQAAQLREASERFRSGVAEIRAALERVAEAAAGFAAVARELAGGREGRSIAGAVEEHYSGVAAAIAEWNASRGVLTATASEVGEFCKRMGGFVAEIEGVGVQTLRLALNAEIQAVHLSASGCVMQSVAEGIRSLTREVSEHAACASDALRQVESIAGTAAVALAAADLQDPGEAATVVQQTALEVRAANTESRRALDAIASSGDALAIEIRELANGIMAHENMAKVAASCLECLQAVQAAAGTVHGSMHIAGKESMVHHSRRNYTMESEGEVHDALVGVAPVATVAAVDSQQGSEFVGNVELF